MKATHIKLNSRHLKAGDKIIRTKPLSIDNTSYTNEYLIVNNHNQFHISCTSYYGNNIILSLEKWNDGNWVRYTL